MSTTTTRKSEMHKCIKSSTTINIYSMSGTANDNNSSHTTTTTIHHPPSFTIPGLGWNSSHTAFRVHSNRFSGRKQENMIESNRKMARARERERTTMRNIVYMRCTNTIANMKNLFDEGTLLCNHHSPSSVVPIHCEHNEHAQATGGTNSLFSFFSFVIRVNKRAMRCFMFRFNSSQKPLTLCGGRFDNSIDTHIYT